MKPASRLALCVLWVFVFTAGATAQPRSPVTVELVPLAADTSLIDIPFRWRDIATNAYAPSYQDGYTYGDGSVTVTFPSTGDSTFTGHLSAANLKPNFAYQMKLVGKPTGLWGAAGDDSTNERLGYAGRWWRVQPNPGNANDADYEAHHDDPDYIYEGYLIFDFLVTDRFGNAEVDFATSSSYHVLWWEHQRTPHSCDSPVDTSTVVGYATDPAYNQDVGPTDVGVYAEIERLCHGETTLPAGDYNCRFMLTEESFHQSGGPPDPRWVSVNGNRFWMNGGPFYYAGTNCYYLMDFASDPAKRPYVDEVLEDAKAMGLNVVRTWAFSDGGYNALQTEPGVYDESVFQGLDYTLHKAGQLGLHLILPFVNNWDDYGGMNQYVEWSQGAPPGGDGFVTVNGTQFELGGSAYYYVGCNYWYGLNLASTDSGGDRDRLNRELDSLATLGITNLRVMAGTEGPDTEPWRMVPSLQQSVGVYDSDVLDGLDYLVKAIGDRGLRAVMVLNNFWPWSGGMAQYVSWNGGGPIPYPPPEPGGDWNVYQDYASDFYSNAGAKQDFRDHINFIVNRVNPYTGRAYRDEPAIMAWELANEPRGFHNNHTAFNQWIDETAAYIKSLDSDHLVTTGCEGDTPWPAWNGLDFTANHDGPDIDYATLHIWPQNWGWYDPSNPGGTYATAEANARSYFNTHEAEAVSLSKPMVLEEFGLARDGGSYDPASGTQWRDTFFAAMYDEVYTSASSGGPAAGSNFWCWAGEGRPLEPYGSYWSPGDPWIGDPPHERQGWYSVYDEDTNTSTVITSHAGEMSALSGPSQHDDFYTDANCKQWYKDHISSILNRVNTFNGITYKNDPTVFAWELANEPRCTSDPSGNTLQHWIEEMAAYVESLDARHMLTTGSEGFYGPTGPPHNPTGWFGDQGVDFIRNHQPADVDFACFHAWPDHWGLDYTQSMTWAEDHVEDTESLLGKPVILEEFGKHRPLGTRDQFYQGWYDVMHDKAAAGKAAGGSNFWILYHDVYPDYDGFGVYYPGDASTVSIVSTEARKIRDLSQPVPNEGNWVSVVTCDTVYFELEGSSGSISVTNVQIANMTLGHTDEFAKNGDDLELTAHVASDPPVAASDIVADFSQLLAGGGAAVPAESYTGGVASWTTALQNVTLTADGVKAVMVTATQPTVKASASGADYVTADNTAPGVVSGFDAEPRHEGVALSWDDPSGLDDNYYGVLVRYDGGGDYPNYNTLGSYPSDETGGDGDAFNQAGVVTAGDHNITTRDIYYYTAFAYDWAMNYGPAEPTAQDRATDYWLGDVDTDTGPGGGDYDGDVDADDIFSLSAAYWMSDPSAPYDECDVGPTDDHGGFGIPEPDDYVGFDDLMIFALNYGEVSKSGVPPIVQLAGPPESGETVLRLQTLRVPSVGEEMAVSLLLGGSSDPLKGARVVLTYDPDLLDLQQMDSSPALAEAGGQVFFRSQEAGPGEIWMDLAVLGTGEVIHGSGEIARLHFGLVADGDVSIRFAEADLRGADNACLSAKTEDLAVELRGSVPSATQLVGAWPNPFNPMTAVKYDVRQREHVTLQILDAQWRLVTTLVDDTMKAGRYSAVWNGRDESGRKVSTGLYLVRMRAGRYESTTKVVMLK